MDWNDEELADAMRLGSAAAPPGIHVPALPASTLKAIMTCAVDLAAARGGTMTADALRDTLRVNEPGITHAERARRTVVFEHCVASGSRIAALEAERDTLSQRLDETNQRAQENWEKQEAERERLETELSRITDRAARLNLDLNERTRSYQVACSERDAALRRAAHAEARVRELAIAGQELSAAVDKHVGGCGPCEDGECAIHVSPEPRNYPCSPTCTHDDATFPGHAGRIVERSEAVDDVGRRPENDADAFVTIHNGVEGVVFTRSQTECYADKRAEAMRAACVAVAQEWAQTHGLSVPELVSLKAAIERATP